VKIIYCLDCEYRGCEQGTTCSVPALALKECKDCERYAGIYEKLYGVKPPVKHKDNIPIERTVAQEKFLKECEKWLK
jgi:hypothetical protein